MLPVLFFCKYTLEGISLYRRATAVQLLAWLGFSPSMVLDKEYGDPKWAHPTALLLKPSLPSHHESLLLSHYSSHTFKWHLAFRLYSVLDTADVNLHLKLVILTSMKCLVSYHSALCPLAQYQIFQKSEQQQRFFPIIKSSV